jgi:hypothetical protein
MARITQNALVKGARGNVGKQFVYKKRGKNTHIALMPTIDKSIVPTENQVRVRDKFADASAYATGAMASPELKAEYDRKAPAGKTGHNLAFRDALKAPVVKAIDPGRYAGLPGALIEINAKDDFRVASVFVSIRTATGELVEEGNAILNPIHRNRWGYTTVKENPSMAGGSISVTAKDIPGNEGKLDITL